VPYGIPVIPKIDEIMTTCPPFHFIIDGTKCLMKLTAPKKLTPKTRLPVRVNASGPALPVYGPGNNVRPQVLKKNIFPRNMKNMCFYFHDRA
jgi:hypothetical protein